MSPRPYKTASDIVARNTRCRQSTVVNDHGASITRLEFENLQDLERFFINLIDNDDLVKTSSKAIGTVLLLWDR